MTAASATAWRGARSLADTPNQCRAAASAPYTPSPHSMQLRYSSKIRRLLRVRSSRSASSSSSNLRVGVRLLPNQRFLANCWVIVLPPRTIRPARQLRCADASISFQSRPAWEKKASSSAMSTA